jgi:hypothetical protein
MCCGRVHGMAAAPNNLQSGQAACFACILTNGVYAFSTNDASWEPGGEGDQQPVCLQQR